MIRKLSFKQGLALCLVFAFLTSVFAEQNTYAQDWVLPQPGTRISLSPTFNPLILKGLKVHPENPFRFEFILDQGDKDSFKAELDGNLAKKNFFKSESTKLIKYFLASLTTPENDMWVNLSPYEKNRIIPQSFGQTEMGRDLLAQDYILKQITAHYLGEIRGYSIGRTSKSGRGNFIMNEYHYTPSLGKSEYGWQVYVGDAAVKGKRVLIQLLYRKNKEWDLAGTFEISGKKVKARSKDGKTKDVLLLTRISSLKRTIKLLEIKNMNKVKNQVSVQGKPKLSLLEHEQIDRRAMQDLSGALDGHMSVNVDKKKGCPNDFIGELR